MGGKRPEKYRIDPAERRVTLHGNLPQTGRGHSDADVTVDLDRRRFAESEKRSGDSDPGAPAERRRSTPPRRDANRPLREERKAARRSRSSREIEKLIHPEPGAADTEQDPGNPLV